MILNTIHKVAVITGAASGIGLALAQQCAQRGMHVVMTDIDRENLHAQAALLRETASGDVLGLLCDVRQADEVSALVDAVFSRYQRVDWLFNNAGISARLAPVWELSSAELNQVMDVNVLGVLHGVLAFFPRLFEQTHTSHVINMASFYGLCSGSLVGVYAMSKHALLALSESLYFDLKRLNKNVNVSVVCPSFTSTPLMAHADPTGDNPLHQLLNTLVLRSRSPQDVAAHILREVDKGTFYILPDSEVKAYCTDRTQAIIMQQSPYPHAMERLMLKLSQRV